MATRIADRSLHDRKIPDSAGNNITWPAEKNRDVHLVGQPSPCLDRLFVSPVNEHDAIARKRHGFRGRYRLCRHRDECGGLWSRRSSLCRPSGRLANIDKVQLAGKAEALCDLSKQRRLLRAGDRDVFRSTQRRANAIKLDTTKLIP